MGVRVPHEQVEDGRGEQLQDFHRGAKRDLAEEREAILEGWASFASIFPFRVYSERLAEIFLMDAAHVAVGIRRAVVPRNQQKRPIPYHPGFHPCHVEPDGCREAHDEGFVLGSAGKTRDRRLEDVGRRLPGRG